MYRLCTIFGSCHRVGIHGRIELHPKLAGVSYSTFYRYLRSRRQQLAAMGISIYAKKIHFSVANYLANDYCFDLKKNL